VLPNLKILTDVDLPPDKELSVIIDSKPIKQRHPAYSAWVAHDQAILGYLLSTLTSETLMHIS
jgi:hypothetical protein